MKRTAKGFTLVEIMIVVAIIGILIAIAVPGFIKARETSRRRACQENLTKIDGAVQQYILENNLQNLAAATAIANTPLEAVADGILIGTDSYLKADPKCPSGGIYNILAQEADAANPVPNDNNVGQSVSCTIHKFPSGIPANDNTDKAAGS